ncbi:MAG: S8 family serine peptidase, partial [Bdellovibrionales bacterium]|nr:S8 family serine peptidase [Bdellovibrionales bacterium]
RYFRSMRSFIAISLLFCSFASWGNILVLEYDPGDDNHWHGTSVHWIACKNSVQPCRLLYSPGPEFGNHEFLQALDGNLTDSRIVNMSFTLPKPKPFEGGPAWQGKEEAMEKARKEREKTIAKFKVNVSIIENVIQSYPGVLFIAAAGNGNASGFNPANAGIGLKEQSQQIPQIFIEKNLIKVAALNIDKFEIPNANDYFIASYSNFGLDFVDVAAPVETNHLNEIIKGTSFAAPYVSRVSNEIFRQFPNLNPDEVAKILRRSCHIKNIDKAIWATQDLIEKESDSLVFKAQYTRRLAERNKILENELKDVILVKCGGALSQKLAVTCARNYALNSTKNEETLNRSCLDAHKEISGSDSKELDQLLILWNLRQL